MQTTYRARKASPKATLNGPRGIPIFTRLRRLALDSLLWPYWMGLGVAFLVLYQRLGAAGENTLQAWFNSDYLFAADIYKDVFIDHFPLSGIHFSIAPCLFPDVVLTSFLMFLTNNAILSTFFYGVVQFTLLLAAYLVCAMVLGEGRQRVSQACILLAAIGLVLYTALIIQRPFDTLYFLFLDESHLSNFALVVFCGATSTWLCFHPIRGRRALAILSVAIILSILGTISDLMFVPHMLVAFTVSVIIMRFLDLTPVLRSWLVVAAIWVGALAGVGLVRTFFDSEALASQASPGVDRFTSALNVYLRGMYTRSLSGDWLHMVALLWLTSATSLALYLIRRHIVMRTRFGDMPEPSRRIFMVIVFLLASAVGSALSIILLGVASLSQLKDYVYSMHYQYPLFFGAVFGMALLAGLLLARYPAIAAAPLKWFPASIAVVLPLAMLVMSPRPRSPLYTYTPPLVKALDVIAARYGLHYGVGGFWQSRWVNMLSSAGVRLYPITGGLDPFHWLGNKYWYSGYPGSRYPNPVYDFAVLNDPLFKIERNAFIARFGPPAAEVQAANAAVLIYNRPSDEPFRNFFTCNATLASMLKPLNRSGGRFELWGSCLPGQIGTVEGHARIAHQGRTSGGWLSNGPYVPLQPGTYSATIRCITNGAVGQQEGNWDLGFFVGGQPIQIDSGPVGTGQTELHATFVVSAATAGRPLEMRVFYAGVGDVAVEKLIIVRQN